MVKVLLVLDYEGSLSSTLTVICMDSFLVFNLSVKKGSLGRVGTGIVVELFMDVEVYLNSLIELLVSTVAAGSTQVVLFYAVRVTRRTVDFSKDHIRIVSILISFVAVWSPVTTDKVVVDAS